MAMWSWEGINGKSMGLVMGCGGANLNHPMRPTLCIVLKTIEESDGCGRCGCGGGGGGRDREVVWGCHVPRVGVGEDLNCYYWPIYRDNMVV